MESIKVIHGKGNISREKINILLDSAIEFYGSKHESVILDVVRNTVIYEMDPNEKMRNAIQNVGGYLPKKHEKMSKACHLSLGVIGDSPVNVVIWRPQNQDEDYYVLAHELYGHAVCGRKKSIIGAKYQRNGIALYDLKTRKNKLELLNEGFMETIASNIVKKSDRNISDSLSETYSLSRKSASYIGNILGKEKVLDDLVEYYGTIEKEYNEGTDSNSLMLLNQLLQQEVKMRKLHKVFPLASKTLERQVKTELVKFKKRKNKIR